FAVAALEVTERAVGLDSPEIEPLRTAERLALVLGQEGPGVRPETLAQTDADVVIPMPDGVDSLNVAAAAAVALWELRAR
ncbi:rRNA methyltransferase, partial [Micrococcus luteus]